MIPRLLKYFDKFSLDKLFSSDSRDWSFTFLIEQPQQYVSFSVDYFYPDWEENTKKVI